MQLDRAIIRSSLVRDRLPAQRLMSRRHASSVPVEGPGWYVPENAAHFAKLGLAAPDFLWLCQEASGNLAPSIGTVSLEARNSPLYRQSVDGWSRKFVGTTGGTANQGFRTNSAVLDIAAGESYAMLVYASAVSTSANQRIMEPNHHVNRLFITATTGVVSTVHNTATTALSGDHSSGVHQFLWYRNGTTNVSGAVTDLTSVTGTHNESAPGTVYKGIGQIADGGGAAPTARYCWVAVWKGANAEQDWPAYLAKLRGV